MTVTIFCDQMPDGWNYDTCHSCKYFTIRMTSKGRNWACSLNNKPPAQKRAFYSIWATEFLRGRGIAIDDEEVIIDYIGKRKRRPPTQET